MNNEIALIFYTTTYYEILSVMISMPNFTRKLQGILYLVNMMMLKLVLSLVSFSSCAQQLEFEWMCSIYPWHDAASSLEWQFVHLMLMNYTTPVIHSAQHNQVFSLFCNVHQHISTHCCGWLLLRMQLSHSMWAQSSIIKWINSSNYDGPHYWIIECTTDCKEKLRGKFLSTKCSRQCFA